jgi:hypothetical protein
MPTMRRIVGAQLRVAVISSVLASGSLLSQDQHPRLLLKVDQSSSGPSEGEKESLCVRIYSNGRIINSEWSSAATEETEKNGKRSRSEKTVTFEYQIPKEDLDWKFSEFEDLLRSKSVLDLTTSYGPPHPPTRSVEVSTIQIALPDAKTKTISLRNYYDASLIEMTEYPAALVILMDELARIEDEATKEGKRSETPIDCHLQEK